MVNLEDLNTFTVQNKTVVLWSPVLILSSGKETLATAQVGKDEIRFSNAASDLLRVVRSNVQGDPVIHFGPVSMATSRTAWQVIDPLNSGMEATIVSSHSATRSRWKISSGKRDYIVEERTSFIGRMLGRKWLKKYSVLVDDREIGMIRERFYLFGERFSISLNNDISGTLNRKAAVAMASIILLSTSRSVASPSV
jgi:hypothetical protein